MDTTNMIYAKNFEEAFKKVNKQVLNKYDFKTNSRIGDSREIGSLTVRIESPTDGKFTDPRINRISYEYAEAFWQFMISGGTDAIEAFKEYPNVAAFINKPKSDVLPANFNTFYGPRIKAQLPALLKELKTKENSRRVVFQILQQQDQVLLDSDETLEYPCTDSVTYYIRDGKLHTHCHMRSENTAIVMQLDFYLQQKLMQFIADECGVELGSYTHSMVSAHIYERDVEYVKSFL
ncbi:putative thymidylate synthase [Pseudomonas phage PspYZU05]|uniref:Putative thymidylate synthase n=1 Tax=Pseudomonas phage PspYZU05 TaxID=1983556 RepID=A0A2U7N2J1_9CAUD|nr:putative thymidylate synthase [Pseudomonas phage PspYZU05]ASD52025.1 putative thymidylate synthase [Pseudomonas phage PspYZU05]